MGPLEGPPSGEGQGSSSAHGQRYQHPYDRNIGLEGPPGSVPTQSPYGDQWASHSPQEGSSRELPLRHPSDSRDPEGQPIYDSAGKPVTDVSRSRPLGPKKSGSSRICGKCGQPLTGQFVRALGDTFHLECFTCYVSDMTPWV
jgi:hypothetical protein